MPRNEQRRFTGPDAGRQRMEAPLIEPEGNTFSLTIGEQPVIGDSTPDNEGRFLNPFLRPIGTFNTEAFGEIIVDLRGVETDGVVRVIGDGLRSKSKRQRIWRKTRSAVASGVRNIHVGHQGKGSQDLGVNKRGGEIVRISINLKGTKTSGK